MRGGVNAGRAARRDPWVDLLLLAISLGCAGLLLARGAGFVLDDHFYLRNAHFDGALHAAGATGGDRPVGALVHVLLFGLIGPHPAPVLLFVGVLHGVSAILFRRILLELGASRGVAIAAPVLWIVVPWRMSLEAWASTGTAGLAEVLALTGLLILCRSDDRAAMSAVLGGVAIALAVLSYESVAVVAIPAAGYLVLRDRAPGWSWRLGAAVAPGTIALAWAYTHRLPGRRSQGGIRNPLPVIDANFGQGIAAGKLLAVLTILIALVGSVLVVRSKVAGRDERRASRTLILGWIILLAGVLPYLTYFYSPYGAGDRFNMLSAFGAALVWASLLDQVRPRAWRSAALAGLLVLAFATRWERTELWSVAGTDAERITQAMVAEIPQPTSDRPIVVGPARVQHEGVVTFYDDSNVTAAAQVAYGDRDVLAYLSPDACTFAELDHGRYEGFDQRGAAQLDSWPPAYAMACAGGPTSGR